MDQTHPKIDPLETIFTTLDHDLQTRPDTPPYATGIDALDQAIWGLHKQEVCVLGGRPGEGKSALALNMAYNLADHGHRVIFLSLEMTREQLLERLFCQVCDLDAWDLRRGKIPSDYPVRAESFKQLIRKLNLYIIDQWGYQFTDLEQLFTRFAGNPPDVLFVDYIQLIAVSGQASEREAINGYLKTLKMLAMKHEVAIVVLSQMNRGQMLHKSGKPSLHQFKSSGALEETADCCLLLWWKTMDDDIDPTKEEYHIIVAKQRHGPPQSLVINFHPRKFRFSKLPEASWKEQAMP